jgi:hypothetical protein
MSAAGSASWTASAHAAKDAGAATGCMGGKFDTSCTGGGKTCGGDVCSWCATAGPGCTSTGKAVACVAASTGDPGWCSTSAECWCSKEGAKCDTKTHHCSFTQADAGAGSSSGSSGGSSSGGDDGGGIDSSTDDGGETARSSSSSGSGDDASSSNSSGGNASSSSSGAVDDAGTNGGGDDGGAGNGTTAPSGGGNQTSGGGCSIGSKPSSSGLGYRVPAVAGVFVLGRRRRRVSSP